MYVIAKFQHFLIESLNSKFFTVMLYRNFSRNMINRTTIEYLLQSVRDCCKSAFSYKTFFHYNLYKENFSEGLQKIISDIVSNYKK